MKDESDKKMRSEYDFSDGVRGRHFKAYRAGHDEEAADRTLEHSRMKIHIPTKKTTPHPSLTASG